MILHLLSESRFNRSISSSSSLSSSSSAPISEHSRLHKLTALGTILTMHPRCVETKVVGAEGRVQSFGAMSALVDLPGVANPLEDDWWLLEGCASGLVMGRFSHYVRTDEVVSLRQLRWLEVDLFYASITSSLVNGYCWYEITNDILVLIIFLVLVFLLPARKRGTCTVFLLNSFLFQFSCSSNMCTIHGPYSQLRSRPIVSLVRSNLILNIRTKRHPHSRVDLVCSLTSS